MELISRKPFRHLNSQPNIHFNRKLFCKTNGPSKLNSHQTPLTPTQTSNEIDFVLTPKRIHDFKEVTELEKQVKGLRIRNHFLEMHSISSKDSFLKKSKEARELQLENSRLIKQVASVFSEKNQIENDLFATRRELSSWLEKESQLRKEFKTKIEDDYKSRMEMLSRTKEGGAEKGVNTSIGKMEEREKEEKLSFKEVKEVGDEIDFSENHIDEIKILENSENEKLAAEYESKIEKIREDYLDIINKKNSFLDEYKKKVEGYQKKENIRIKELEKIIKEERRRNDKRRKENEKKIMILERSGKEKEEEREKLEIQIEEYERIICSTKEKIINLEKKYTEEIKRNSKKIEKIERNERDKIEKMEKDNTEALKEIAILREELKLKKKENENLRIEIENNKKKTIRKNNKKKNEKKKK